MHWKLDLGRYGEECVAQFFLPTLFRDCLAFLAPNQVNSNPKNFGIR